METLNSAIRQFRHNNSDGFVMGYDRMEIDKIYSLMRDEITRLSLENEALNGELRNMEPI